MVEALSIHKKWKGYAFDYEGSKKLVFTLKEPPSSSCLVRNGSIRISTETTARSSNFEVKGYFPDRDCIIVDPSGNIVAQVYNQVHVLKVVEIALFLFVEKESKSMLKLQCSFCF